MSIIKIFNISNKNEKLAILGGKPAVTIKNPEQWERAVEKEKKAVCELIDSGFLSESGKGLPKRFEDEFRKFVGAKYCLAFDHGSTALASAYYAVGVGPGDEVITPTLGYIGSYEGAFHMGARPVFCDVDPKTLLMDPEDVEKKITKRTKAINPIHLNGRVCDMDALLDIGKRYSIPIIEDAAHAYGAEWRGKKIGNVGDITCFSLQGVTPRGKPVSGGEGGIATTNNREFYERQLIYCHLHRDGLMKELTRYKMLDKEVLGKKWRAHPLALAIAKVSLDSLKYRNQKKIKNRKKIFNALEGLPGIKLVYSSFNTKPAGFYGGLKVIYESNELGGLSGKKFIEAIKAEGALISGLRTGHLEHLRTIFTHGFDLWGRERGPLGGRFHGLPPFKRYKEGDFPVAESVEGRILAIPAYINPKKGFLDQYIKAFQKVIKNYKSLV